jgi:hypothetical protein
MRMKVTINSDFIVHLSSIFEYGVKRSNVKHCAAKEAEKEPEIDPPQRGVVHL